METKPVCLLGELPRQALRRGISNAGTMPAPRSKSAQQKAALAGGQGLPEVVAGERGNDGEALPPPAVKMHLHVRGERFSLFVFWTKRKLKWAVSVKRTPLSPT